MKIVKSRWTYGLSLLFLILFSPPSLAADFVLKDVIESDERIANQRPILLLSPMTGEFIKIKNKWFEVRFFIFETKTSKYEPSGSLTFAKLINQYNLLYLGASPTAEGLFPGYFFYASREVKMAGINFLLSLRQVSDEAIVTRLENAKENKSKTEKLNSK